MTDADWHKTSDKPIPDDGTYILAWSVYRGLPLVICLREGYISYPGVLMDETAALPFSEMNHMAFSHWKSLPPPPLDSEPFKLQRPGSPPVLAENA